MAKKLPRLPIAGLSGDSGKTIVSLSLLTALSQKGLAVDAISHGRITAEAIHQMITGEAIPNKPEMDNIRLDKMVHAYYEEKQRTEIKSLPVEERFKELTAEITNSRSKDEAINRSKRCMSCGICFDCGTRWSFCQNNAIIKPLVRSEEYTFKMEFCNGCKKCAE